jgi:streptogramin lyase
MHKLWFTDQSGVYGRLDPSTEKIQAANDEDYVEMSGYHA